MMHMTTMPSPDEQLCGMYGLCLCVIQPSQALSDFSWPYSKTGVGTFLSLSAKLVSMLTVKRKAHHLLKNEA